MADVALLHIHEPFFPPHEQVVIRSVQQVDPRVSRQQFRRGGRQASADFQQAA